MTKWFIFIRVSDETLNLALTYLQVRWRTQGYIVLDRKYFLLVGFSESYFVTIEGKTLLTQNDL